MKSKSSMTDSEILEAILANCESGEKYYMKLWEDETIEYLRGSYCGRAETFKSIIQDIEDFRNGLYG